MKYFFVPGRKWELSFSELNTVLNVSKIVFEWVSVDETVFVLESSKDIDLKEIFSRLGGFVKCGIIVGDSFNFIKKFATESHEGKINFALSGYSQMSANELFRLGMEVKSFFKESGLSSRYVSKRKDTITSAPLIDKNKVLESGFELNLFDYKKKKEWGRTVLLQDYEGFSKRDYGRPNPNKQKGMLPPKLARIMVNLAGLEEGKTIWDPFCGSGTVLQESLLLGYRSVGSDSDEKSIEESQQNLEWLAENFDVDKDFDVFRHDATHPLDKEITFDAIVTEPYIGPVLRNVPKDERIDNIISVVTSLYRNFLLNLAKTSDFNGRIVIVVPGYKSEKGWKDVNIKDIMTDAYKDLTPDISDGKNLHWDRPNSIIRRQIKILSKK
jgi:tRNA G10  N-methylase Trm11